MEALGLQLEAGGCSPVMDMTDLPQQVTQPLSKDQTNFDPDGADFLESSLPTEPSCSGTHQTYTDLTGEFQETPTFHHSTGPTQQVLPPSCSVTRDLLNQRTQQLIDDINLKRKRDTTLLADFKKALDLQVSNSCESLEQAMYQMYEANGKVIQGKLQELCATLDRISKLEMELSQFKTSLGALYSEIQGPSTRPT